MTKTHVAYDTQSGRIISVHHGEADSDRARKSALNHAKISPEHIGMITVTSESVERGKRYKVDISRKTLVEDAHGVSFGFSIVAQSS